jgi:hypothetical protein
LKAGRYEVRVQHTSGPGFGSQIQVHADNKWASFTRVSITSPPNNNLKANQLFVCYIDVAIVEVAGKRNYAFSIVQTE